MVHLQEKYCDIIYDEQYKIVITKWKGFATGEQVKEILEKALALLISKKSTLWLGDCSFLPPITAQDQEWINTNWFPRAMGGGIKKMAVVEPQKGMQKNIVDKIMDEGGKEIMQSCTFGSYDDAYNWLKS